jgi:hypothetical protein
MRRKLVLGMMALALPVGLVVVMGAGSATASANAAGKGTYNCTKVAGTISFKPPLKTKAQTVTETVKVTSTGCKGGTPNVASTTGTSTSTKKNQSCTGLASSTPFSVKLSYTNGASASQLAGTAKPSISGTGVITFVITGKTTLSYPSTSTVAKGVVKQTESQLLTACTGAGVSSITITSGSITKA